MCAVFLYNMWYVLLAMA